MKRLIAIAATAICCMGNEMPAKAYGGLTQQGAIAWCASRAAGNSIDQANNDMRKTMSAAMLSNHGGFAASVVQLSSTKRQMQNQLDYAVKMMCPEFYGSANAQRLEETPIMPDGCYYGDLCKKLGL
jgi:hypothetical protein